MVAGFQPFGAAHLVVLGLTAAAAFAAIRAGRAVRGRPAAMTISGCFLGLLAGAFAVDPFHHLSFGQDFLAQALPLELCDAAGIATMAALVTRRPLAFELALYWGLSATLQAVLTPNIEYALDHPDSIRYFLLHSGIIVAVLYLGPGLGLRPRPRAVRRMLGWTAAYAAVVGTVDLAFGANYMYLRAPPPGSVLDLLGPWPWYLVGGGVVAVVLFTLIDLPYRLTGGHAAPSATHPDAAGPAPS